MPEEKSSKRSSSSKKRATVEYTRSAIKGNHCFPHNGTIFDIPQRYKFVKGVGTGAYGVVISALNEDKGEKVAIKKVLNVFADIIDAKRILREVKLLQHFSHENIMNIRELFQPESLDKFEEIYIESDLMDTDLHRVIYSHQKLSDEHIQYFVYQILRGLKYIHSADVIHRDLKPSNVLMDSNCDLKICDFGLARGIHTIEEGEEGENAAALTEYVVTRWYRAPEIMLGNTSYTKAVDVWSVGCIFAEILGRKPFMPGDDYMHQLQLIAKTVGTPSEEKLRKFVTSDKAIRFMNKMPRSERKSNEEYGSIFKDRDTGEKCNPQAIDLLFQLLEVNPNERITVEDALKHPYLSNMSMEEDEPICETLFDFSYETDHGLDQLDKLEKVEKEKAKDILAKGDIVIKELMLKEIGNFHPSVLKWIDGGGECKTNTTRDGEGKHSDVDEELKESSS